MSDHEHEHPAPLVALTPEEGAETMISEGAPLGQPHGHVEPKCCEAWDRMLGYAEAQLRDTVRQNPLKSLLVALGVGLAIGGILRRD